MCVEALVSSLPHRQQNKGFDGVKMNISPHLSILEV